MLFDSTPGIRRLAAFSHHEFPLASEQQRYACLDAIAAAISGKWRSVHECAGDPTTLPPALRPRCGTGLLSPQDRLQHRNDVEHLRATLGARFDTLVDTLREFAQCSRAAVIVRPEFQAACSIVRWTRGHAPDLIVSFGLGEPAMQALFASWLLDVPRVHVLESLDTDGTLGLLLPVHVQQSALLVASNQGVATALQQRFGAAVAARTVETEHNGGPTRAMREALLRLVDTPRDAHRPTLGPLAAFRTDNRSRLPTPNGTPRALLLLAAERTGSNMLRDALEANPTVACAGELFNRRDLDAGTVDWLRGSTPDPTLLAMRLADPAALHDRLLADGAARGATTVGCKLLYGHGAVDDRIVDHFASLPDLTIVHLRRRDGLRRHLSLMCALRDDRWHTPAAPTSARPSPTTAAPAPISLSPRDLAADLALTEQFEQRYGAVFAGRRPIECEYRQLVHAPEQFVAELGERLGTRLQPLQPRSRRTGGAPLATAITNLDDLRAGFAGTRWAQLFDDQLDADGEAAP